MKSTIGVRINDLPILGSPVTYAISKPTRDEKGFCRANILLSRSKALAESSDCSFIGEIFLGANETTTISEHSST